jgi:hypothetical protein
MLISALKQLDSNRMRLLYALFKLGMADQYQLSVILQMSLNNIQQTIKRLNYCSTEEGKVILSYRKYQHPRMYALGPVGWKMIMDYLQEDSRYYEKSEFQMSHYRGVTGILARLIQRMGYEQALERLEWYNTLEATECLKYPWSLARWNEWKSDSRLRREEEKRMIRPDSRLMLDDQAYWIEFDNGTELEKQIKEKYRMYIRTLGNLPSYTNLHNPVVWVTTNEKRKNQMKQWWLVVKEEPEFQDYTWKPLMGFFVPGEETELLLQSQHSKTKWKR